MSLISFNQIFFTGNSLLSTYKKWINISKEFDNKRTY